MSHLDWIESVDQAVLELEEKPQFGLPHPFDWNRFESGLRDAFDRPDLKIEPAQKGWIPSEELWVGLGEDLLPLTIEWTPIDVPIYFVTTEQDVKRLMGDLLGGEKRATYFYDLALVQGFYHYFAAEMLNMLDEQQFATPLAARIGETKGGIQEVVGQETCFVIDVSCTLNEHMFWGRILIPKSFRTKWKSYFANLPPPVLSDEMRQKLAVEVSLEVGHSELSLEEWKGVREGDVVVLDHCTFDPCEKKGGALLTLNEKPLFRGRFKEEGIKLTEYPKYEEVSASMEEEEEFEEELEEDLYGDETEKPEMEVEEASAPPPSIQPEDLPVHLTVEVGRLKMSAQELMDLSPGNLIDLNVAPEQGVDLVINGKKVGRGELVRLGEMLGVRIVAL